MVVLCTPQVSIQTPCCKKWYECPECHDERENHSQRVNTIVVSMHGFHKRVKGICKEIHLCKKRTNRVLVEITRRVYAVSDYRRYHVSCISIFFLVKIEPTVWRRTRQHASILLLILLDHSGCCPMSDMDAPLSVTLSCPVSGVYMQDVQEDIFQGPQVRVELLLITWSQWES